MVGRGNDVIDLLTPYSSKTSRATARTTRVSWYQKGKTSLDLLEQKIVAVAAAGPYANLHLDPDT